jgi:hypothetical protein
VSKMNVQGLTVPANDAGFQRLLARANDAHADGLILVSVVQLSDDRGRPKLGAIFVRMPDRGPSPNLFGE